MSNFYNNCALPDILTSMTLCSSNLPGEEIDSSQSDFLPFFSNGHLDFQDGHQTVHNLTNES